MSQAPVPETSNNMGLLPRLGLATAIMVIMGNMIGSGVFKKAVPMADAVQSPGLLLLCWVIAGVITLMGSLTNAEVAGILADAGGQYAYFKRMYGRLFSFLYGWTGFFVIQSASIASIAYVFGESANALFTFPRLDETWESYTVLGLFQPFNNIGVKLFTVATLVAVTSANYFGVVYGGLIANITGVLKLAGIAAVVVLGLAWGGGSAENFLPLGPSPSAEYGSSLGLFGAMFAAMLGAFWAFDGWINITFLGGEVRNPRRNIPLALGFGVAGVMVVYLAVNAAYLYVFSVDEIRAIGQNPNGIVAVEAMRVSWGPAAATFVAVVMLISTFGSTNCQLMPTSRMYLAMARDGLFFRLAGFVHPRFRTPGRSLYMQCAWACTLVFSGTFDQLTDMVIFASFIFYGAAALGVFVLRRTMPDAPRTYKVFGYPVVPLVFAIFCYILVVVTIFERPRDAGIGLVLILAGLPFYWYWNNRSKRGAVAEAEPAA